MKTLIAVGAVVALTVIGCGHTTANARSAQPATSGEAWYAQRIQACLMQTGPGPLLNHPFQGTRALGDCAVPQAIRRPFEQCTYVFTLHNKPGAGWSGREVNGAAKCAAGAPQ